MKVNVSINLWLEINIWESNLCRNSLLSLRLFFYLGNLFAVAIKRWEKKTTIVSNTISNLQQFAEFFQKNIAECDDDLSRAIGRWFNKFHKNCFVDLKIFHFFLLHVAKESFAFFLIFIFNNSSFVTLIFAILKLSQIPKFLWLNNLENDQMDEQLRNLLIFEIF